MEYQAFDRQDAEMTMNTSTKTANLRGPIEGLPPANTKRWVIRRKAAVVSGVRNGIISLEDACRRYNLSVEEFLSWQRLIEDHGLRGLRVTRLKDYRERTDH
tara:strand:- start:305 stop:610 length:306 start_codon:yes stop_codon:yes gene_type:complete